MAIDPRAALPDDAGDREVNVPCRNSLVPALVLIGPSLRRQNRRADRPGSSLSPSGPAPLCRAAGDALIANAREPRLGGSAIIVYLVNDDRRIVDHRHRVIRLGPLPRSTLVQPCKIGLIGAAHTAATGSLEALVDRIGGDVIAKIGFLRC